jgi:hypothetical protein
VGPACDLCGKGLPLTLILAGERRDGRKWRFQFCSTCAGKVPVREPTDEEMQQALRELGKTVTTEELRRLAARYGIDAADLKE